MTTLNPGAFTTVFDDNFRTDTAINTSIWTNIWGYPGQISLSGGMLTLTSFANQYYAGTALMQRATGPSSGEGYGLYQVTAYTNPGQGIGVNLLLWRADNVWLDPKTPGKATEMDLIETYESPSQALSTIHYYDPGSKQNNGSAYHTFPSVNPTQVHTYSLDWERGSLTYYIDGQEMYKDTVHAPLDYADGGSNEVMGLQVSGSGNIPTSPTVAVHILEASYSAPAGTPVPTPTPTPTPNPTPTPTPTPPPGPVTLGGGTQSYTAPAGTVVLAGSGNDTVTASSGLVTVTGSSGTLDFIGGTGASSVAGGSGPATIFGGSGGGVFTGGAAGNNILISQGASGKNTTLTGGGAGDRIFGSAGGTDALNAGAGANTVVGGGGPETISGGSSAAAAIFTGNSNTVVNGGAKGGDQIITGRGATTVQARSGDAVFGNTGSLNVSGSGAGGNDSIVGGAGALSVTGHGGNMLVVAATSTSTINVGSGASLVYAGSGTNTVTGGTGSLQLVVGSGKSSITEGAGSAVYDITSGAAGGSATISNFKAGSDHINLYGYSAGAVTTTVSGGSTLLSLSDGTKIELLGVTNLGNSVVG